jgi:RNA polymerase primary sigma factor
MAVMAGVESSVQIHIDRGDNLNSRDQAGQTPLMLSAARNKAAICRLLIAAGADAELRDPTGRSALAIAEIAGAHEAALAIAAACSRHATTRGDHGFRDAKEIVLDEPEPRIACNPHAACLLDTNRALPVEQPTPLPAPEAGAATFVSWIAGDDDSEFDLTGWETEEVLPPPDGDPSVFAIAIEIQSAITEHRPIDTSADWDDIEAFLPDRATPPLHADDAESRERLRFILLRALREGSVPLAAIEDLTRGANGEPDAESCALLGMVINDLGAETDERFEYSSPHESFEVFAVRNEAPDEEDTVVETLAFLDDLARRRNDPLRIYQREFQREALLTAEAEVALGQAMERGVETALDALAAWPTGVGSVVTAANCVVSGEKPLRWLSSGPQVEHRDAEPTLSAEVDSLVELATEVEVTSSEGEGDLEFDPDDKESIDELAELFANAKVLSGIAVSANQNGPEWSACRGALASLSLARSFLLELADSVPAKVAGPAFTFAQSMKIYRCTRDQMIVANLKLVFSIAKKYLFSNQPLDDLLQEGNIGLMKAVDRYDWRRGFKFSTYASWWIRQCVGRYVANRSKTIRLPAHVYDKTQRIAQAVHGFEFRHGHVPTTEELAEMVQLPIKKVVALATAALDTLSLQEVDCLDDHIAVDAKDQFTCVDPMDVIEDHQLFDSVDRLLGTLKAKEAGILRMRFGIGIQDSMTLEEIGAKLDVTRERIRQIEKAAISRLKHPSRLEWFLREFGIAPPPDGDLHEVAAKRSHPFRILRWPAHPGGVNWQRERAGLPTYPEATRAWLLENCLPKCEERASWLRAIIKGVRKGYGFTSQARLTTARGSSFES